MSRTSHGNSLPEGHRLHWYRIKSVLGQGGFGITYLASDTNLDREVAVKEYLPVELAVRESNFTVRPFTEDRAENFAWGLDRFIKEAKTLAGLDHPNVVRVHAVFEENGTAYMVMALERGKSLDDLAKFGRIEGEGTLLRIAHALLNGLEYVHEAGFIHRDIKPDNVVVRPDGTPVLLDFGSARVALGTEAKTKLTSVVSRGFAPYEQYHGEATSQGPWTDIYGIGATLYAAINRGEPPIDALVRGNARIEGKVDPLIPVSLTHKGKYSEKFLAALDASLAFLPTERPQSIGVWRTMLPPPGAAVVTSNAATELHPSTSGVITAATSGTATGAVTSATSAVPAPATAPLPPRAARTPAATGPQAAAAPAAAPRKGMAALAIGAVLVVGIGGAGAWWWLTRGGLPEPEPPKPPVSTVPDKTAQVTISPSPPPPTVTEPAPISPPTVAPPTTAPPVSTGPAKAPPPPEPPPPPGARPDPLIVAGDAALAAGRLVEPADESARDYYRYALILNPDSEEAKRGLERVAAALVARALERVAARNFDEAQAALDQAIATGADPGSVANAQGRLADARREVEAASARDAAREARQARIAAVLDAADRDFSEERLVEPAGQNALERYREALALDPGSVRARTGIKQNKLFSYKINAA